MKYIISLLLSLICVFQNVTPQSLSFRDYGFSIGILSPGQDNSITDVSGVLVGHLTLSKEKNIRTGVTAIIQHTGNIETPVVLTNTLSVPVAGKSTQNSGSKSDLVSRFLFS